MTEIPEIKETKKLIRYSVHPAAFVLALICAPLAVTALSFWTVIGLFALPFGIGPYLIVGTPLLLWAVGRIKPRFWPYALLGLLGNIIMAAAILIVVPPQSGSDQAIEMLAFLAGFGLIFGPLYAGAFGWLYASFHPNLRILQT